METTLALLKQEGQEEKSLETPSRNNKKDEQ